MAQRLATGQPLTIVAIGSSSTAGAGASKPELNYPSRLQAELAARCPRQRIIVRKLAVLDTLVHVSNR